MEPFLDAQISWHHSMGNAGNRRWTMHEMPLVSAFNPCLDSFIQTHSIVEPCTFALRASQLTFGYKAQHHHWCWPPLLPFHVLLPKCGTAILAYIGHVTM